MTGFRDSVSSPREGHKTIPSDYCEESLLHSVVEDCSSWDYDQHLASMSLEVIYDMDIN